MLPATSNFVFGVLVPIPTLSVSFDSFTVVPSRAQLPSCATVDPLLWDATTAVVPLLPAVPLPAFADVLLAASDGGTFTNEDGGRPPKVSASCALKA